MTPRRSGRTPRTPAQARSPGGAPGRQSRAFAVRGLAAVVTGVSLLFVVMVIVVAGQRLDYPYQLEWLEGAVLQEASRLLRGLPLYPPPSLSYAPLNYPPLYFMAAAGAMRVLGEGFLAMRAVSLAASVVIFVMLFWFVRRATGRTWAAVLALGLFAACFRAGGAWLDVGRLDTLSVALLLGGVLVLDADRSPHRGPLAAAALVVLAFLAKPTAIVMFAPVLLWCALEDRGRAIRLGLYLGGLLAAAVLALDAWSAGGFRYYTFGVASRRPLDWRLAWHFPVDLLRTLAPASIVIGIAAWMPGTRQPLRPLGAFIALAIGHLASTWILRTHIGCYENVLIPVHLSIMGLTAVAYARLNAAAVASHAARRPAVIAGCALLAQLVILAWDPRWQVPTADDRAEGDRLVELLRNEPGRVLFPSHPYLLMRAGKPENVHVQCFMDIVKGSDGERERALLAQMRDSLDAHAWDMLVLDNNDWLTDEAYQAGYRARAPLFRNDRVFWPVTGMKTRPEWVWFPDTLPSRPAAGAR